MSVMQRNSYGGTATGQPLDYQSNPQELQRQAVLQQLAPTQATQPGQSSSSFARGGQVKQLPTGSAAGTVGGIATGGGTQIANKLLSTSTTGMAAGAGIGIGTSMLADKIRTKEEMPTFGGEFGDITDAYGRRFQTTGGGMKAGAVRGAGVGANPGLIAATGGLSVAGGALIGAGIAAAKKHAPSAYSDFRVEDAADAIKQEYRQALGRDPSDEEIQGHLVAQGWDPKGGDRWVGEKNLTSVLGAIKNSPEAQAYRTRGSVVDQLGTSASPSAPYQSPAPGAVGPTTTFGDGSVMPTTNAQNEATLAAQPANTQHWAGTAAGAEPKADTTVPADAQIVGGGATGGMGLKLPQPTDGGYDGSGINPTPGGVVPADAAAPAGADTDGYAAPAFTAAKPGAAPPGWDANKWNDPNNQHPKYVVGRILSQYPPTVDGLKQAFGEIQKAYPGAKFDGKDKISIPGVGNDIDVLQGAGKGGEAWRWAPPDGGGSAQSGGGGMQVDGARPSGLPTALDSSTIEQLKARLAEIINGQPNREALVNGLGASNG